MSMTWTGTSMGYHQPGGALENEENPWVRKGCPCCNFVLVMPLHTCLLKFPPCLRPPGLPLLGHLLNFATGDATDFTVEAVKKYGNVVAVGHC